MTAFMYIHPMMKKHIFLEGIVENSDKRVWELETEKKKKNM